MNFGAAYSHAVNSTNLIDDDAHHQCMPLGASGLAGRYTGDLGSLLLRAKTADGVPGKVFESGCRNLGPILRIWVPMVHRIGAARKWSPASNPREVSQAKELYTRVAESALAYWLDNRCNECQGATVDHDRRTCQRCKGTGIAEILMRRREIEITKDLVSELEDIMQSHARRGSDEMRDGEINLDAQETT